MKAPAVIGDEKRWELGIDVMGMHKRGSAVYGAHAPCAKGKGKAGPKLPPPSPGMHMRPTLQMA